MATAKAVNLVIRIFLSFSLLSTVYMLWIQIRFLDNHPIGLSPPLSSAIQKQSFVLKNAETETKKNDITDGDDAIFNDFSKKKDVNCDELIINDGDADADADMKPILKILCQGGYDVSKTSNEVDRSRLPKWSEILAAYGPPKILGLETCQAYRDKIKPEQRRVAPAGMFNTGTNLLQNLLHINCDFSDLDMGKSKHSEHFAWQVPWGKHMPFSSHTNHTAFKKQSKDISYHHFLPVVSIRDPYTWMQSMCRQPYAAQFDHANSSCPNIVPYPSDIEAHPRYKKKKYMPVHVHYDRRVGLRKTFQSIAHLWNEWYTEYIEFDESSSDNNNKAVTMKTPDFPFLVVRMEDMVFHADTVLPQVCECLGGTLNNGGHVKHYAMIANQNIGIDKSMGVNSGLLRSVVNYGNITKRRDGYPAFQLEAAKDTLDSKLMNLLEYRYEEP